MKIIEILNSLPTLKQLAQEKGLSPRAKFQVMRNLQEIDKATLEYEVQKKQVIESLGIKLEPLVDNPDMSRLVFEKEGQEAEFVNFHKPLLEVDVKLPHIIASLELINFVTVADLMMMGDFVNLSDLEG